MGNRYTIKLSDIGCLFKTGGTPQKSKKIFFTGNIPWITTTALNKDIISETDAHNFITFDAIKNSSTKIIKESSIMIGIRVGVGKTSINSVPMCTNQDIVSLENIDDNKFDKKYILYCIKNSKKYLESQKRGATIQGITVSSIKNINIPLTRVRTR